MRKVGAVILTFLAAVFLSALPAFAAKAPLSDDALDLITAGGQPKVIQIDVQATSDATVSASLSDTEDSTLALADDSQTTLKALTLNNVVGENEVATATNVASALIHSRVTQTNTITQSWGSTKDTGAVTVPGVTATALAVFFGEKCILSDCAVASAVAAPGQIKRLTTHADEIVDVSVVGDNVDLDVLVVQDPQHTIALASGSQSDLAALVVNNVAGKNLLASATNIVSGGVIAETVGVGGFSEVLTQSNTINQFRGTPFSRPD